MLGSGGGTFTLITGATSGIGEGLALALSATHDLILHGRDATRLQSILERCKRRDQHRIWNCDLAGTQDVGKNLAAFLDASQFRVQNFIHSAGVVKVAALRQTTSPETL